MDIFPCWIFANPAFVWCHSARGKSHGAGRALNSALCLSCSHHHSPPSLGQFSSSFCWLPELGLWLSHPLPIGIPALALPCSFWGLFQSQNFEFVPVSCSALGTRPAFSLPQAACCVLSCPDNVLTWQELPLTEHL